MTSIYCTDCTNYDESEPTICCSNVIRPIRAESQPKTLMVNGILVERSADKYFDVENWGNS